MYDWCVCCCYRPSTGVSSFEEHYSDLDSKYVRIEPQDAGLLLDT